MNQQLASSFGFEITKSSRCFWLRRQPLFHSPVEQTFAQLYQEKVGMSGAFASNETQGHESLCVSLACPLPGLLGRGDPKLQWIAPQTIAAALCHNDQQLIEFASPPQKKKKQKEERRQSRTIVWMDRILHHLRPPGIMISPVNTNKQMTSHARTLLPVTPAFSTMPDIPIATPLPRFSVSLL